MKEVYFFRHDYNPTNDPKIICLLGNYGGLGYGVFWRITELLNEEETHKLQFKNYIFEAIAKQMLANAKQIEAIIRSCIEYELFETDNEYFWSNRVLRDMEWRKELSIKRAKSGSLGGKSKQVLSKSKQSVAYNRIEYNNIKYNNTNTEIEATPIKTKNLDFDKDKIITFLVEKGLDENSAKIELEKFILYWTEPNQQGKQRWQAQKFFDVRRRLVTWINKSYESNNKSKSINLDNL